MSLVKTGPAVYGRSAPKGVFEEPHKVGITYGFSRLSVVFAQPVWVWIFEEGPSHKTSYRVGRLRADELGQYDIEVRHGFQLQVRGVPAEEFPGEEVPLCRRALIRDISGAV